ncbi:MAG: ribosomal protein S18-alanine N-acetyltransferase [bacterium]|nr:ribosomal protein S18-alanine N-acetyltransferase [bacterium]
MLEDTIQIMLMQETDLDAVVAIEAASFSDPWKRLMFATELKEIGFSTPLVVKVGDTIIGYAIFWQVLDEAHLGNFAIKPEYRRNHIGSQLLQYIIEMAQKKKVTKITLEVRQSNTTAIELYHRFGFREIAIRRNFYTKPVEDALVMMKNEFH